HLIFAAVFGDGGIGGEGAAAELPQVNGNDAVFFDTGVRGEFAGGGQLKAVALAVVEGQSVKGRKAVDLGDGETGGTVESAGEEDDRWPAVALHGGRLYRSPETTNNGLRTTDQANENSRIPVPQDSRGCGDSGAAGG